MFIRIDDRLVHGQVVTAWLKALSAKEIIIVDDTAGKNQIIQTALKLAVPKGIGFTILAFEDLASSRDLLVKKGVLLIVKSSQAAERVIQEVHNFSETTLNIGNIGKADGRKKYTNSVYLDDEAYQTLERISQNINNIFYQTVPADNKKTFE